MKIYRLLIWITLSLSVVSFVIALFLQSSYCSNHYSFEINILIGIFASSFLLFVNSVTGFYIEKSQFLRELKVKSNSLRLLIKKTTTAYTKLNPSGSNTCEIKIDDNFKTAMFEILPYVFDITEHIKKLPKHTCIKRFDVKELDIFCKDLITLTELICEMQVDRTIKVDLMRIQELFNLEKINRIIGLHAKENEGEYISWTV